MFIGNISIVGHTLSYSIIFTIYFDYRMKIYYDLGYINKSDLICNIIIYLTIILHHIFI